MWNTNMAKENVSLDSRLTKIDETRNYLLDETEHYGLMSEEHRKVCRALNSFEHFLVFVSAASGCVSISAFASLVDVPVGIANFAVGLKIWALTSRIKMCKSIIMKKRKKHCKIVLLAKTKLNTITVLISKALIDSYINHDSFFQ